MVRANTCFLRRTPPPKKTQSTLVCLYKSLDDVVLTNLTSNAVIIGR